MAPLTYAHNYMLMQVHKSAVLVSTGAFQAFHRHSTNGALRGVRSVRSERVSREGSEGPEQGHRQAHAEGLFARTHALLIMVGVGGRELHNNATWRSASGEKASRETPEAPEQGHRQAHAEGLFAKTHALLIMLGVGGMEPHNNATWRFARGEKVS